MNETYMKISRARESVAGSNILPLPEAIKLVKEALQYSVFKGTLSRENLDKICKAHELLVKAKEYGDRLEPDNLLCEVLNDLLRGE